ncbi:MAG: hypothetical protein IH805_08050 [Proteobacteria bacterium]|nr:hypothetical protein [Pseudomonadota bacterium]
MAKSIGSSEPRDGASSATVGRRPGDDATQAQGNYDVKVIIPNGISDEHLFSI